MQTPDVEVVLLDDDESEEVSGETEIPPQDTMKRGIKIQVPYSPHMTDSNEATEEKYGPSEHICRKRTQIIHFFSFQRYAGRKRPYREKGHSSCEEIMPRKRHFLQLCGSQMVGV